MSNPEAGLSHDHRMCRAFLHANPGSAARSPLASAAFSTTSPPTSVPWPSSTAHDTSAETSDSSRDVPAF